MEVACQLHALVWRIYCQERDLVLIVQEAA